jgi:hypothetical protein
VVGSYGTGRGGNSESDCRHGLMFDKQFTLLDANKALNITRLVLPETRNNKGRDNCLSIFSLPGSRPFVCPTSSADLLNC